jgi:ribosomal protein L2
LFLKKIRITSNASRNLYKISSAWWDKGTTKKLDFRRLSRAGRASHGRIVVYSKASFLKKIRKPRINYSFRLKVLTFVSTLKLIPFENKLVALLHTFNRGLTYIQVNDTINVFDIMYFPYTNPK